MIETVVLTGRVRRGVGRRLLAATGGAALLLALLLINAGAAHAAAEFNGIIFVHGIEGSGGQFESQAMRFTSNDYPINFENNEISEVDYNSTRAVGDKTQVFEQIDAAVAEMKAKTGRPQVDIVAHSLGTSVMYEYLTSGEKAAARRANVAHYINVDGQEKDPGVSTLAIWAGRGTAGRHMEGAQNVTIPDQTHVQTCTSAETFVQEYKFLRGVAPKHDIAFQRSIQIAGKALNFPENTGAAGDKLQIWPVNSRGARTTTEPIFQTEITDGSEGGGKWGPVAVRAKQRYEFALIQPHVGTLHYYYEPFVHNDYTLRLDVSAAIENYTGNRPGASAGVMIRYEEYWGNEPGQNDRLLINGLNVCTASLCPWAKQVNAYFAFDANRDGKTELTEDPVLGGLPFLQGADVFIRGHTPTDETISFQLESRRAPGVIRTLAVPNWETKPEGDGIVIQWDDFEKLTF